MGTGQLLTPGSEDTQVSQHQHSGSLCRGSHADPECMGSFTRQNSPLVPSQSHKGAEQLLQRLLALDPVCRPAWLR